jgi:hypothetical protein
VSCPFLRQIFASTRTNALEIFRLGRHQAFPLTQLMISSEKSARTRRELTPGFFNHKINNAVLQIELWLTTRIHALAADAFGLCDFSLGHPEA